MLFKDLIDVLDSTEYIEIRYKSYELFSGLLDDMDIKHFYYEFIVKNVRYSYNRSSIIITIDKE